MATPHRYVGYHQAPNEDFRPHHGRGQGHRSRGGGGSSGSGGGGGSAHSRTHYRAPAAVATVVRERDDRTGRLITLGIVFMVLGLILYFGGGFLFVAAYNGAYPVLNIAVESEVHRYYWWVGPICFFIGLFMFIVAFATFCKGLKCNRRTTTEEGYF